MAYNIKFQVVFDNIVETRYMLQILQKDFLGGARSVLAAADPVIHKWDTDEPKAPIKGSSLTIKLINDGSLPITTFYSNSDVEFKVRLTCNTLNKVLFEGFIVQEDCIEDLLDYNHEIELTATDNLGLLKEVTLNKALESIFVSIASFEANTGTLAPNTLSFSRFGVPVIKAGDKIVITGTQFDQTVTVASAFQSGSSNVITTTETLTSELVELATITIKRVLDKNVKISLATVLQACLIATQIELPVDVYANIYETTTNPDLDFLQQTLINRDSFSTGETGDLDNCYEVLEKILIRFNCTLFQSMGKWNVLIWDEAAYMIPWRAYRFDSGFALLATPTFEDLFTAGLGETTYAETGINRSIIRPFEYVKEQFDYVQPQSLLLNADLSELGDLITSYPVNEEDYKPNEDADVINDYTVTFYEYKMPKWFDSDLAGLTSDYVIRVIKDEFDNELERYAVIKGDAAVSTAIEATAGDKIKFTFQIRSGTGAVAVPNTLVFVVQLKDATQTKYADEDNATWKNTVGYTVSSSNTYADFTSIEITTGRIPFDGLVRVYLPLLGASETHYNDMRFEYISYINESTKIIGHTHKRSQAVEIKNNLDAGIYVDDSPRNYIAGTLFTPAMNGLIQQRTQRWAGVPIASLNPTPISCVLVEFQVFGADDATYTITGTYCDGSDININAFVGDGTPVSVCARPGTVAVTGNVTIINDTQACDTYTPIAETSFRLGEIITYQTLQWKSIARTQLEGQLRGLIQGMLHVSMLSIFKYTYVADLNFIFGRLEINYRQNQFAATLHELYKDGEDYTALVSDYLFNYIYNSK